MRMISTVFSYFCPDYAGCASLFSKHLTKSVLDIGDRKRVVIKINMCDLRTPETGAVTHPHFLREFILAVRALYPDIQITIIESDATVVFADKFFKWIGFESILQDLNIEFVNIFNSPAEEVPVKGRLFKSLPLPLILKDSYFVSMAKLKTNVTSFVTFVLKNQYAFVRGLEKSLYHNHLDDAIVDANLLRKPDFSIVDGILAHIGPKGPAFGIPYPAKCVIWGNDPVATDSYCSKIIGINPVFVGHIRRAKKAGLGSSKYDVQGDYVLKRFGYNSSLGNLLLFKYASKLQRFVQMRTRRK